MPFNSKHLTIGGLKHLIHYDAIYHPSQRPNQYQEVEREIHIFTRE
jgi:hypothetical protein